MDEYSKMIQLFQNWLDVVADAAVDDAYENTLQNYSEFAELTKSQLEDIIMDAFYEYYMSVYNDPDSVL